MDFHVDMIGHAAGIRDDDCVTAALVIAYPVCSNGSWRSDECCGASDSADCRKIYLIRVMREVGNGVVVVWHVLYVHAGRINGEIPAAADLAACNEGIWIIILGEPVQRRIKCRPLRDHPNVVTGHSRVVRTSDVDGQAGRTGCPMTVG